MSHEHEQDGKIGRVGALRAIRRHCSMLFGDADYTIVFCEVGYRPTGNVNNGGGAGSYVS